MENGCKYKYILQYTVNIVVESCLCTCSEKGGAGDALQERLSRIVRFLYCVSSCYVMIYHHIEAKHFNLKINSNEMLYHSPHV